uniref:Uncharacterized protein n=1 Tax=Nyssomyia neivai TaxID=330878 RepID=A0A1L8DAP9_9DIPT
MPPPKVKLYNSSGKKKNLNLVKVTEEIPPQVTTNNLELELCWCVQKLEISLSSGKLTEKQALETEKTLRILKGAKQPIIKKRQVMKNTFGDYRAQMEKEEKELSLASKKIKFTTPKEQKNATKSHFVKKSALLHSGKDFKFNFNIDGSDQQSSTSSMNEEITTENTDSSSINKFIPSDNTFRFNFEVNPAS